MIPAILVAAVTLLSGLLAPAVCWAHGPVNPEASDYLARVTSIPSGLAARSVDGDLRMWLNVGTRQTVTVLDYQGIPYLRFTPAGTDVNERSAMYYLNQTPPEVPPTTAARNAPPRWQRVSTGETYEWHDGRLHALAAALASPGARALGRWEIPLRVSEHRTAITGVLDRAPPPSLAWLWPVALIALLGPALRRVRDEALERRVTRALAWFSLLAGTVLCLGEGLHGRPGLSIGRLITLAFELALVVWLARRLARGQDGPRIYGLVASLALYRGLSGISVLFRGYVLLALPEVIARAAVAGCLATSLGLGILILVQDATPKPSNRSPARAGLP